MGLFNVMLIIAVFVVICGALFYMQRVHVSFNKRVFLALVVGIVVGLLLQLAYGEGSDTVKQAMAWINVVGSGFISLLKMLIIPLVLFAILSAFTGTVFSENFGKYAGFVIGMLAVTVAIAGLIGVFAAHLFHLQGIDLSQGGAEIAAIAQNKDRIADIQSMNGPEKIVYMLPSNIFSDFAQAKATSVISVVIFAVILGMAYMGVRRKQPEQAKMFAAMVEAMMAVVMRMVTLILRLTPYGILALIMQKAATSDLAAFWNLGKFIVASYVAIAVMFGVHMLILRLVGLSPVQYMRKIIPVMLFSFSSRSSAGALPMNLETQKKRLGVPAGIADMAGAFGLTIGQNGCAGIYPAMLAMMVAPTVGIDPFTLSFIVPLILVIVIGSFGVAGVGGGGIFAALIVLSTLGLPVAIVGLLISIEPLIDMARTALNVSGSMLAGVVTGRATGELDKDVYAHDELVAIEGMD